MSLQCQRITVEWQPLVCDVFEDTNGPRWPRAYLFVGKKVPGAPATWETRFSLSVVVPWCTEINQLLAVPLPAGRALGLVACASSTGIE